MRFCPRCTASHEEGTVLCRPCKRVAIREIRKQADMQEEMFREEED